LLHFIDKIAILVQWDNPNLMRFFSFRHFFVLLSTVVFSTNHAFSQQQGNEMGLPFITSYKASDYDGESQNWAFMQDDDGIIFIANTIGFIEYDGVSWRHFKPENDGLPISLAKDKNGIIYAGGTGFIGRLITDSLGNMVFESLRSYLPKDFYIDFVFTTTNFKEKIYFQNQQNVISWDGNKMQVIELPDTIELLINTNNHLFVDTKSSFYEIIDDKMEQVPWAKELSGLRVRSIIELHADTLLIGTYGDGLYLLVNGKLKELEFGLNDFFKKNFLFISLVLPDGKLAIGTKKAGVIILNKDLSVFYRITKAGGLADNDIKGFYLDLDNRLWIATDNGFSALQYPIEFTYFDSRLGIGGVVEEITSYQKDLITGTFLGSFKLTARTSKGILEEQPYAEFNQIAGTDINNMALFEYEDKLLIGTSIGTVIYDGAIVKPFDKLDSRKFFQSRVNKNVVFQGHRYGCDVLIFEGGELKKRISVEGLSDQIRGIAEDVDGRVWLCTMINGVYRVSFDDSYNTTLLEHFSVEEGLPSMRDNLTYRVEDEVIFTTHKGIFAFEESKKEFIPDATFGDIYSDYSRFVYAFYFDENKDAWINSFRKKETARASIKQDGSYELDLHTFTPLHNMLIYDMYKEPNGVAWFGGSDGLARYEAANYKKTTKPFLVKIRKVIVNSDSLLFNGHRNPELTKPVLTAEDNEFRFETAAIYYDELNEYQYRLEGYENIWSSWSNEPFKIYTNLNQGDYSFQVRAKNIKGVISVTDSYYFKILPPWYLTWWFLVVSFIVASMIMTYIIRYFATRKLIKRVEELELIQKAQTQRERISRDLHDNVGSNLTYIISSLDYLSFKTSKDKDLALAEKANDLSGFTRDTMHQLRDTIWHISSEEVTLDRFIKRIEEMCFRLKEVNDKTDCKVTVKGDTSIILPPLPALNLFRVVQESVNNAFKHAEADSIMVEVNMEIANVLNIKIIDDGVGFKYNEGQPEGHYGLINLKSRMDDINAVLEIDSKINEGTTVEVSLEL